VHSTHSWDGRHPLPELVAFLRGLNLDFVLMSEHDRGLDQDVMRRFVSECAILSDDRFLVIPGIEYEATPDYVHVLAYNTRELVPSHDAAEIARGTRRQGGLAVLAHPHWKNGFRHVAPETLALLQGWEVWNGKADGRWAPDQGNLNRYHLNRRQGLRLLPFAGADLHRTESYPGITLQIDCLDRSITSIMDALTAGAYRVAGASLTFSPDALPDPSSASLVTRLARSLPQIKRRAQRLDKWLHHRGVQFPAPLYRAARRFFR